MDKKLLVALPIIAVLVIGGGIAAWSAVQDGKADVSATRPIIGSSNTTATPTITPTPTPTAYDGPEDIPEGGFKSHEQGTDDTTDEMLDLTPWTSTAGAATMAFLTWDTDESDSARTARLAPHFVAGADALTDIPVPAGEDLFDYEGFTSTVEPTIEFVGIQGPSVDGKTVNMVVTTSYRSHFKSAADEQETFGDATFIANVSITDPKHIISLTQE